MRLENFQGIRHAEFRFDGQNAAIYGDNATGKTTVFNAFTWLLFGKASTGADNFTPKTKTADGDAHNLEHSAECEMDIDGNVYTLKRVYRETYRKTRGSAEAEFSGHTTDYFINGVPKKEKEYQRFWEDIFSNEEMPKLLSMPFYFAETLHWEKRRAILLDICGNVSDAAVMESDSELRKLPELAGVLHINEYKKVVKATLSEVNRKIQSIPARIDEAQKAIPDTSGLTRFSVDTQIERVRAAIREAEDERAAMKADGGAAAARARIIELNDRIAQARLAYNEQLLSDNAGTYDEIRELRGKLSEAEDRIAERSRVLASAKADVEGIERTRAWIFAEHAQRRDEYAHTHAEVFDETDTICRACGQPLQRDKASELRELFNLRKSARLEGLTTEMNALVERGKHEASKEMLSIAKLSVDDHEHALLEIRIEMEFLTDKLAQTESKLKDNTAILFEATDEYKRLAGEIAAVKTEEAESAPDTSEIDERIASRRKDEESLNAAKAALDAEAAQKKRIAELECQEHELGHAYEEAERALYLCDKFSRVKASMLTDKINGRFKTLNFQLFRKNITNGGTEDVCEVLIPSENGNKVPFQYANNAARINAGLEIISVLGKHYGAELPVFVDNAESVTRVIPTDMQLIKLVVSENDKHLRLELP
jgi:DNA repair exonuclease SbcCD ATPase subunit